MLQLSEQTETEARIEHLNDIKECLLETYGGEPEFLLDLDEIVVAINNRIFKIRAE